ncbi:GNAT family N-acetyltransferase [Halobaculum magnesiiphilum]|uniref:GNAT family N-acetyltransferase n=1 Tax=Halobaculum magnesiiphilum TaxID=1017351 RepID=A0A8T8WA93_9EURY|nr:GNAT family N-acetyltransferase [Halobaculum magnesiiphilum]QZP36760.1 GNAT family N-acetyltransferase [Halobaculum magnesiiphilum]
MDLRDATTEDVDDISETARASLSASYGHALSADLIDDAVESWYDAETVTDALADEDAVFVVAVEDGDIVGFVQSQLVERREPVGELDWLHVHPDHRGKGVGDDLLRRAETELLELGAERLEGRVLAANEAGGEFYEREGFAEIGDRTVEIGDQQFRERVFARFPSGDGEQVLTEARVTDDGDQVYVAYDEAERASKAPFYATYADRERTEREGYVCGNCGGFAVNVDTMDRVECSECGNKRKASRWDAAYL